MPKHTKKPKKPKPSILGAGMASITGKAIVKSQTAKQARLDAITKKKKKRRK